MRFQPNAVCVLILAMFSLAGLNLSFADDGKVGFSSGMTGGFTGPGPNISTVEQAKAMNDGARVSLKGHLMQSLGDKHYVFQDSTGTITVEIKHKRFHGQNITPEDLILITGKVDKDLSKTEIEVKELSKQ